MNAESIATVHALVAQMKDAIQASTVCPRCRTFGGTIRWSTTQARGQQVVCYNTKCNWEGHRVVIQKIDF